MLKKNILLFCVFLNIFLFLKHFKSVDTEDLITYMSIKVLKFGLVHRFFIATTFYTLFNDL